MNKKSTKKDKKADKKVVHRIKSTSAKKVTPKKKADKAKTKAVKAETTTNKSVKLKKATKKTKPTKKKGFLRIFFGPLISLIKYIKGSWQELKKVRWPSRKETWQKVLSIIVYGLFFIVLVLVLDNLFNYLFKLILQTQGN